MMMIDILQSAFVIQTGEFCIIFLKVTYNPVSLIDAMHSMFGNLGHFVWSLVGISTFI